MMVTMARKKLGELLVQAKIIDETQLKMALDEHHRWGTPLGLTLLSLGLVREKTLVRALSHQLNIPSIDLETTGISEEVLRFLPVEFCQKHTCIPFRFEEKGRFLDVALFDPTNLSIFDSIRVKTQCNVRPFLAGLTDIERAILKHYLGTASGSAMDSQARPRPTGPETDGTMDRPPLLPSAASPTGQAPPPIAAGKELLQLRTEMSQLRALLDRNERHLRVLMNLLVEKRVCGRDELISRLKEG
jgi:type IV pilus assembly protein PilB